ncbi:MAG: outer membrane protein assembly factor BamB [Pseudomonadota bacterium]|nr:MAG: outer membrane protein assembly factor BamB [Pseudomonadota bacterium]
MSSLTRITALAAALMLAGCQTIGGWFSSTDESLAPAELADIEQTVPVRQLWSTNTGRGLSRSQPNLRPYHDGQHVWVADHRGQITAVNAASGATERQFETDLMISAGPAVYDGLLLVGTFDGELVAMNAESGAIRWRVQLSSEVLSYPLLHDGVIVVRCIDGRVFGLDRSDGARLWIYDRGVPLLTLRGNSDPLARAGQVFVGYDDGTVVGLRVADGSVVWEQAISTGEGRTELERLADIDGPMVIVGNELYVVTYHGRLASLALESGRILWVSDVASSRGVSLRRTQLAVSGSDGSVLTVDRRNGSTVWRDDSLLRRGLTRPVFYGSLLVVADAEGYLHFYDGDTGRFVARQRAGKSPPAAAPLVVDNVVYLLDSEGRLSAWRAGASG